MMKGPNAPMVPVDLLIEEVKPGEWKNIPVPLVEAIKMLLDCCTEFKKQIHANYNEVVQTQRVININQMAQKREGKNIKGELFDEMALAAQE